MIETDICIVGAGPAGLSAAAAAGEAGASVLVVDENFKAGGQLFKQVHKFFGSENHKAGTRGSRIGEQLLDRARKAGAVFRLRTLAYGFFENGVLGLYDMDSQELGLVKAKKYIFATGAIENVLPMKGGTLPGVMGAGAAQTLMHLYHTRPGNEIVMVGSGNVGLIVSYQLMQSGAKIAALVEAAPKISGYEVHARKLLRAGVKMYTSTTVSEIKGEDQVEEVVLTELDSDFKPIPGSEFSVKADTVCVAVGLSPLTELLQMAGCKLYFSKVLGGFVPLHGRNLKTTHDDIYLAGDCSGIEEASTAMEEGRIAGIGASAEIGFGTDKADELIKQAQERLDELRQGPFGDRRKSGMEEIFTEYEKGAWA